MESIAVPVAFTVELQPEGVDAVGDHGDIPRVDQ
jgi:hypothetical protein